MNTLFVPSKTIEALRGSPLCPHIEHYVTLLKDQGYRPNTLVRHVDLLTHFHRWLVRNRLDLKNVNEELIEMFLKDQRAGQCSHDGAPLALRRLLGVLRSAGVTPPARPAPRTSAQCLVVEYQSYLREERGYGEKTVENYARNVERFLTERFGSNCVNLRKLKIGEVIGFVQRTARDHNKIFTKQLVTALRSFLRYLQYRGEIETDWASSIPAVAHWRLAGLPKRLPAEEVERILAGCDRSTALGRRDYAIMLLLARLGLRGGEVVRMQLEDINWASALLTVRSKKGRGWARMPLPTDVGRAIARYLRHDRPACSCRNVFVRIVAPYTRFNSSAVVGGRVRSAMKRAGVTSARKGAHVFRHSLASEMLRKGASLDEIGQVLRHKDPDTTAIYAKVDLTALRQLAVSLPGGAE